MTRKREIIIQKQEAGERVIDFLTRRYTYHDREKWTELIINENLVIDGNKVKPDHTLINGEKVIYYPEPIIEPPVNPEYGTIYEDDNLLVIDKPADLPCHPGGIYFEHTLWYILKQKYDYISLINRLDRETSGVMLVAKNKEAAKYYFNKMMEREISKEYLVLVHGKPPETIDAKGWLLSDNESVIRKKRKFILDPDSFQPEEGFPDKEYSYTTFKRLESNNGFSLIQCRIITGRTHQIRATISSLGYPVVGDKIYGLDESFFFKFINDQLTLDEWKQLALKNQALHSCRTELTLQNGEKMIFESPLPEEWNNLTNKL